MDIAVVVMTVALIITVIVHIAVIARWSGKIDGFIVSANDRILDAEKEILRLREARHHADGELQRQAGMLHELERRRWPRPDAAGA